MHSHALVRQMSWQVYGNVEYTFNAGGSGKVLFVLIPSTEQTDGDQEYCVGHTVFHTLIICGIWTLT